MGQILMPDNSVITYNDEWSFLIRPDRPSLDIPDSVVIYSSYFSCEQANSAIFRPDMTGVTLVKCHLENVIIPPGNTLIDCFT